MIPQRHPIPGSNTSHRNQDIDLNLFLDFLDPETPIRRTHRVRQREARNNRTEAGSSGSQRHVVVTEAYLQGLLEQIAAQTLI